MTKKNKPIKGHKFEEGSFLMPDYDKAYGDLLNSIYSQPDTVDINTNSSAGIDPLSAVTTAINVFDTLSDISYNSEDKLHEDDIFNTALKGTAQDRHVVNQLYDIITTGGGLWGKTTADREIEEGVKHARDINTDMFSNINNINNLSNAYNINSLPDALQSVHPAFDNGRSLEAAAKINPILQQKREEYVTNFYDQVNKINQRQQRQNMMNYFAEGGSLDELNGVTEFNYEVGKEYDVDEDTYNTLINLGYKIQIL